MDPPFGTPPPQSSKKTDSISPTQKKTIVIWDIPPEINKRKTLLDHFTQFGDVERMTCSLKSKYALLMFNKAEEAELAKKEGTVIEGVKVQIFFTQKTPMGSGAKRRSPGTPAVIEPVRARPLYDASKTRSRFSLPNNPFKSTYAIRNVPERTVKTRSSEPTVTEKTAVPISPIAPPPPKVADKKPSIMVTIDNASPGTSTSTNTKILTITSDSAPSTSGSKAQTTVADNSLDILSLYPDTTEAQELFGKKGTSAEERYKILEARDKILRARIPKVKMRVELAAKLFGTCPDMCPEKERYMREYQRQLTPYEIQANQDQEVDHQKAIKVYSRSSADQEEPLPHELRPGNTLEMTMNYILHNVISRGEYDEESLADWYNFVWDRTRSIRKDITQQQLCDSQAVSLMEKCARFHIHCSSRLCELDRHAFDEKLNDENLMKCLQSLEHLYSDLRLKNVDCPNEPEFRSYQILMNLNEGDILWEIQQKPESILKSAPVQRALKIHHAVSSNNFVAFFRLVRESPYLTACIVHRYFFQVRSVALRSLVRSHSANQKLESWASATMIQRMLGYGVDDQEMFVALCLAHGITTEPNVDKVIISRRLFYFPETPSMAREPLIDRKLTVPIQESINGGPLPPNPFPSHVPQCSFDEDGYLIPGPIILTEPRTPKPKDTRLIVQPANPIRSSTLNVLPTPATTFEKPSFSFKPLVPTPLIPSVSTISHDILDAQRKKEEKKKKVETVSLLIAERLFHDFQDGEIQSVLQQTYLEAYNSNVLRKKKIEEITQRVATSIFSNMIKNDVGALAGEIMKREYVSAGTQLRISETILDSVVKSTVSEAVLSICTKERSLHVSARRLVTLKAGEIYQRIKLRGWIAIWRRFTEKKLLERKLRDECRQKLIREFPAGNQYGKSPADVLTSWCGSKFESIPVYNLESLFREIDEMPSRKKVDDTEPEQSDCSDVDPEECIILCSYEEFVNLYPGIDPAGENTKGLNSSHLEPANQSSDNCSNFCDSREESEISPKLSPFQRSRKRSLSPQDKNENVSPNKVSCWSLKKTQNASDSNGSKDENYSPESLHEEIKTFISNCKVQRGVWNDSVLEYGVDENNCFEDSVNAPTE